MSENFRKNNIAQSSFEKNYNQIRESKREILNQKYNCSICLEIIKHENPFLCYNCQKIFHNACLKHWDERQKYLHKTLSCPNCRNELPLEKWKVFRNYDTTRTKDAQILNQAERLFNPDEYVEKSMDLFKIILNKFKNIHPKLESQKNYMLYNLIEEFKYNLINPSIDEISTIIIEELDLIEEYMINVQKVIQKEKIKYKNKINLKYLTEKEGNQNIVGYKFVDNNINNISLIINGEQSPLVDSYNLREGENNITFCIKNKLTNLSNMFNCCYTLYNIDELKYLNTEDVIDFSGMFQYSDISNIKALEDWDTSKSETFSSMFNGCHYITSIKPLQKWNVSRCKDFSEMFRSCHISDISPIKNWNISKCENLSYLLTSRELKDISPIQNWNISNVKNLSGLFSSCEKLKDISPIKNWNISNCENLSYLFSSCINLKDISPIQNWNISNIKNISGLFSDCIFFSDINPIKYWNVSNVQNFSNMFSGCSNIKDIIPLENWNVSKGINFSKMFSYCGISELNPIKNWNVSNGQDFSEMFYGCSSLSDVKPMENWNTPNGKNFGDMFGGIVLLKNRHVLDKWK